MAICQGEGGVGENSLATNRDIDIVNLDVLGLATGADGLQGVDGHVELLVRLGRLWLVEQPRGLVLYRLEGLLLLLGGNLALGLLELLAVDLGLDLPGVGGLQVDGAGGDGQGGGHGVLGADLDGLVQPPDGGGFPLVRGAIGLVVLCHPLVDELLDLGLEGGAGVARGGEEQLGDDGGGVGEGGGAGLVLIAGPRGGGMRQVPGRVLGDDGVDVGQDGSDLGLHGACACACVLLPPPPCEVLIEFGRYMNLIAPRGAMPKRD